MTEPTVRELVAQTRAALDAGDGEYAKMLFAALMELLVRKRNERFAQGDSLLPKGPFSERDLENLERVMDALEREGLLSGEWRRRP
jgi:hypothetical protein